eukprot:GDKK01025385.1.p1 GENE.GDKK01025385.1~~GDKK01025385.1.p1  ORF type:complete len:141 (-),score=1.84 GDKK01025385.1:223-645(-)
MSMEFTFAPLATRHAFNMPTSRRVVQWCAVFIVEGIHSVGDEELNAFTTAAGCLAILSGPANRCPAFLIFTAKRVRFAFRRRRVADQQKQCRQTAQFRSNVNSYLAPTTPREPITSTRWANVARTNGVEPSSILFPPAKK